MQLIAFRCFMNRWPRSDFLIPPDPENRFCWAMYAKSPLEDERECAKRSYDKRQETKKS